MSSYCVASHATLGSEKEKESFLETHIEPTDNCGWPKLPSVLPHLVYLITNCIAPFYNKKDLKTLIELLVNYVIFYEKTGFERTHDLCHELGIPVIILESHKRKVDWPWSQSILLPLQPISFLPLILTMLFLFFQILKPLSNFCYFKLELIPVLLSVFGRPTDDLPLQINHLPHFDLHLLQVWVHYLIHFYVLLGWFFSIFAALN